MNDFDFHIHFGIGSLIPMINFLIGVFIIYLYFNNLTSLGMFLLLIALCLYVLNNILKKIFIFENDFNTYLEDFSLFLTFELTIVIYGILFYGTNYLFLSLIIFYSMTSLLSLARNSVLHLKHTMGWPIMLNGLFFPIFYYIYQFYLGSKGDSIFLAYFLVVSFLSISKINFLGNKKGITDYIEERQDTKEARNIYSNMLKTNFKKKN